MVAREMAHVRTLDTRLGIAIVVLLNGIPFVWDALRASRKARTGKTSSGRSAHLVVWIGLALVAGVAFPLAIMAPLFALPIRFAIGGQRVFLADATSVELTRNPRGLERALSKLARDRGVLRATNRATRHLYFVDPVRAGGGWPLLPNTHPAIQDRIERARRMTGRHDLRDGRSD